MRTQTIHADTSQTHRKISERFAGQTDRQTDRRMHGRTDGRTDRRTDRRHKHGHTSRQAGMQAGRRCTCSSVYPRAVSIASGGIVAASRILHKLVVGGRAAPMSRTEASQGLLRIGQSFRGFHTALRCCIPKNPTHGKVLERCWAPNGPQVLHFS